jgi:hypothetical protein
LKLVLKYFVARVAKYFRAQINKKIMANKLIIIILLGISALFTAVPALAYNEAPEPELEPSMAGIIEGTESYTPEQDFINTTKLDEDQKEKEQKEIIYLHPMGPGEQFYLHVFGYKIEQISEYASFRGYSMIQGAFRYLSILLILFLFLLSLCFKKIISKTRNKKVINILKKARKVILWIIVVLVIIFILTFFVSFASANLGNLTTPLNLSYKSISADVDLYSFDNQVEHTGMNYETEVRFS